VSTSDEQDSLTDPPSTSNGGAAVFPPPATFNVMSNWIFDGIDISKVRLAQWSELCRQSKKWTMNFEKHKQHLNCNAGTVVRIMLTKQKYFLL
jgi:hypothetical protein